MSRVYYGVYRDEVMSLARSIVIKSSHVADAINRGLVEQYPTYVVPDDPSKWKYYLNLAGEYHVSNTMMYVRSMDTLETIEFTKENLKLHRATAREYTPGSLYYNNLVRTYPTQTSLIKGIIYPVDIQKAIDSNDGEILYLDPQYVEGNEDTFASELQDFVTTFHIKWFNEQYILTDDLYLPTFIGMLSQQLPLAIMNIRLRNAKTPRAHSFHIREYLASNGRLDGYMRYLTKKQQLWLYRNLRYLQRNVGKQEIFERLINNILTPRGIPLIEYEIRQNVETLPDDVYPSVEMVKKNINFNVVQPGQDKLTVGALMDRTYEVARENPVVAYDDEAELIDQTRSDRFSHLQTKVLDSEVSDRSNSSVRALFNVLLNEWIHLASTNRYRAYVSIPNPRSGEYMTMTVKDALIVAIYCYWKARGESLDTIPALIAYEVQRPNLPTYNELASIVDQRHVPRGMIGAIMDRITPLTEYISTEQFYLDCARFHGEYLKLWELYSFQEHYMTRGYCEQMVRRHYMHKKCRLVDEPLSFEYYFKTAGYQIADLGPADLEQLLTDTVNIATGANLVRTITLGEIQKELLGLMKQLSSYPLLYLRNVAFTEYNVLGIPAIRLGDYEYSGESYNRLNTVNFTAISQRATTDTQYVITDEEVMPPIGLGVATDTPYAIDPTLVIREDVTSIGTFRINMHDITIRSIKLTADNTPNTSGQLDQYKNSTDPDWPTLN